MRGEKVGERFRELLDRPLVEIDHLIRLDFQDGVRGRRGSSSHLVDGEQGVNCTEKESLN